METLAHLVSTYYLVCTHQLGFAHYQVFTHHLIFFKLLLGFAHHSVCNHKILIVRHASQVSQEPDNIKRAGDPEAFISRDQPCFNNSDPFCRLCIL